MMKLKRSMLTGDCLYFITMKLQTKIAPLKMVRLCLSFRGYLASKKWSEKVKVG